MRTSRVTPAWIVVAALLATRMNAAAQQPGTGLGAPPKGVEAKTEALMQQVAPGQPGVLATNVKTTKATVQTIDAAKRMVTLRLDDGIEVDRTVAPDVDLRQVKPGDHVTLKEITSVAVSVTPRTRTKEPQQRKVEVETAEPGQKPARLKVDTEEIAATVAAIDPPTRSLTLRNPDGSTRVVQVASRVKLDNIQVGDQVTLRLTKAVVLSVEAPH